MILDPFAPYRAAFTALMLPYLYPLIISHAITVGSLWIAGGCK